MHQDPQLREVIGRFWATVEQEGNSVQKSLRLLQSVSQSFPLPIHTPTPPPESLLIRCLSLPIGLAGWPRPPHPMSSPGLGKKCKVSLILTTWRLGELGRASHLPGVPVLQAITVRDPLYSQLGMA